MSPWKMTSPITSNLYEWEHNPYYWAVDPVGNQLPYIYRISMQLTGDKEVLNLRAIAGEIDFQHRHIEFAKLPIFLENAEQGNYEMVMWNAHNAQAGLAVNVTYGIGEPLGYDPDPEIQKWLTNRDFRIALSTFHRPSQDQRGRLPGSGHGQAEHVHQRAPLLPGRGLRA